MTGCLPVRRVWACVPAAPAWRRRVVSWSWVSTAPARTAPGAPAPGAGTPGASLVGAGTHHTYRPVGGNKGVH